MNIPYIDTIYRETEPRLYDVYSLYDNEFWAEETQIPEVSVTSYESPVKRTYPMLAQAATSQASQSSHSSSSPSPQHSKVWKYLNRVG